jgi:hypothetical protein
MEFVPPLITPVALREDFAQRASDVFERRGSVLSLGEK